MQVSQKKKLIIILIIFKALMMVSTNLKFNQQLYDINFVILPSFWAI
jgi:hypothetical protein